MAKKVTRKKQCKRIKKDGSQCKRWARDGYDVCPKHGAGSRNRPGGRPAKTGLFAKKLKEKLKEKIRRYKESDTLTDLRENIATKRALLDELISKAARKAKKTGSKSLNVATINNAVVILDAIGKDIERLEKIEHGIKYTISISMFQQSVTIIVGIIDRNVRDEKTKHRIFRELSEFGISGSSGGVERITEGEVLQPVRGDIRLPVRAEERGDG